MKADNPKGLTLKEEAVNPHGDLKGGVQSMAQIDDNNSRKEMYVRMIEECCHGKIFYWHLKRVETNKGSHGVDGMSVKSLREHIHTKLEHLRQAIEDGTYQPSPVRRVEIPKPNGGVRLLGIPTVTDRFIQQAIAQVLTPCI